MAAQAAQRKAKPRGRPFEKGVSGNPGGQHKKTEAEKQIEFELVQACRTSAQEMFGVLRNLALRAKNEAVRKDAAQVIIERGFGKAIERSASFGMLAILDQETTVALREMKGLLERQPVEEAAASC